MNHSDKLRSRLRHNGLQKMYFEGRNKPRMKPSGSPYLRRHVAELMAFAQIQPEDTVLEVGCGMGRYTLLLAEMGVKVTGLDLSGVLLERLRKYNQRDYEIPLVVGDIMDPPVALYGRFDAVIGFFTLHHLYDIGQSMAAMARLLKKDGGRIVFLEPNAFCPLYYVQIAFTPGMSWQGERGVAKMRAGVIEEAMRRAGLTAAEPQRFGVFPPFIANMRGGAPLERVLERNPLWGPFLPFQLFKGVW